MTASANPGALAGKPSDSRVVVVRARINDTVGNVIVRFESVRLRICAESELQYLHSWESELITQCGNFSSYISKVFGDNRQIASFERHFNFFEKVGSWPFFPGAVNSRRFSRRN